MSIEIIKERSDKIEQPLAGIGSDGEIILPHTDPNRCYIWYTNTNLISIGDSPFNTVIARSNARLIYNGGEINIILNKQRLT